MAITGSTRQDVMAKAILAACRPCHCGSGSGAGTVICLNGLCISLAVPMTLTLSVNAIQLSTILGDPPFSDNLPRFLGDFTLTYLENEVTARDVDSITCADVGVSYGNSWFGDWINCTDLSGAPDYFRYYYDACTGVLALQYKTRDGFGCYLDPGWPPKEESYVRNPDQPVDTLTVSDCANYFASAAGAVFTGSVAA